jgi:hypothetical protein
MFSEIIITAFIGLVTLNTVPVNASTNVETEDTSIKTTIQNILTIEEKVEDTRADRIKAYYEKRNMPLADYSEEFIKVSDKYGLDWRLLPAIAVRESSGGKHQRGNNPFGWASCNIAFEDFGESIEVVGWNLSGNNPNTARYYKDNSNLDKLYYYNGTVMPSYPAEVLDIMDMFENTEA